VNDTHNNPKETGKSGFNRFFLLVAGLDGLLHDARLNLHDAIPYSHPYPKTICRTRERPGDVKHWLAPVENCAPPVSIRTGIFSADCVQLSSFPKQLE